MNDIPERSEERIKTVKRWIKNFRETAEHFSEGSRERAYDLEVIAKLEAELADHLRYWIAFREKKAAEARGFVEALNNWLFDAELGYRDGIEEEIAAWEETAERLERSAEITRRELAELEGCHEEA